MKKPYQYPPGWFDDRPPRPIREYPKPKVGDRVRFHGLYLANTGQQTGSEGQRIWTVIQCDCRACADGRWVLTDQVMIEPGDPPVFVARHIAACNLTIFGTLDIRNSP